MESVYSSETTAFTGLHGVIYQKTDLVHCKASLYISNSAPKYKIVHCINFTFFKRIGLEC
jgi:hypothetical protein